MMPREDIVAIYEQGPNAVVELVELLFAQLADQQEQLRSQQEMIASLRRLMRDSRGHVR
jgi:hypothetical protein